MVSLKAVDKSQENIAPVKFIFSAVVTYNMA